jgi:hypothetical protein
MVFPWVQTTALASIAAQMVQLRFWRRDLTGMPERDAGSKEGGVV